MFLYGFYSGEERFMSNLCKVLARDVHHPFSFNSSTNLLNNKAFHYIDGAGPFEEFSWMSDGNNFEPDRDCGFAEDIHENDELYEDDVSITLIKWNYCKGYRYPKEYFSLVKDPRFEQQILRERYPKEYIRLLFPRSS
jgi:hypothetical protein